MRHSWALVVDLCLVSSSAFLALLVRDNFVFYEPHWQAIVPYAAITLASTAVIFGALRTNKALWRYTSLADILHLIAAVTFALWLSLFVSFALSRLEGIARSIPVIQWLLLTVSMVSIRVAARMWHERYGRSSLPILSDSHLQHVLIVGASSLTELYIESLHRYASKKFKVVGILSDQHEFRGRLLRRLTIFGLPEELPRVIAQLEVHGVTVDRVAVTQAMDELSLRARDALLALERDSAIQIDWLQERLGWDDGETDHGSDVDTSSQVGGASIKFAPKYEAMTLGSYGYLKRAFDIVAATLLIVLLAPFGVLVGLVVAFDVGFPIVFWQQRPGRAGRPFKLYKFRTMQPAHDSNGDRIPDVLRSSYVGILLRRTRLDEIPQLYNILTGEMSFVGPRPLLPWDQPEDRAARLRVRPGLTGLAQVHGERSMSPTDKNTLDLWYIHSASFSLDLKIILRTIAVVIRGDRIDDRALQTARKGVRKSLERTTSGSERDKPKGVPAAG